MKRNKKKIMLLLFAMSILFIGIDNVYAETTYFECGDTVFPSPFASICRSVILILQIVIPLGIIVMGSLDFLKATIAGDAEKMKKCEKQFITRIIAGVIAFLVFVIVKFVVSLTASNTSSDIMGCVDCLINDKDSCDYAEVDSPFKS